MIGLITYEKNKSVCVHMDNVKNSSFCVYIWDNHNKQWLQPMAIFFGEDGVIWKINAVKPGEDPLSDGWYDLQGDDLKKIAICDIKCNTKLLPKNKK